MDEGGSGFPDVSDIVLLFAEDFINHMMLQNSSDYTIKEDNIPSRETAERHFNETIKNAISIIESDLEENVADYYQLFDDYEDREFEFTMMGFSLEKDVIAHGFNAKNFLIYLVKISRMACAFYECGLICAPLLAMALISELLRKHMPANGWNIIRRAAEMYGNNLDMNEPQTANLKSNEIEHRNQTKDEASGKGLAFASQSSKHNVYPENEERTIVQQEHETVCQKYGTSTKSLCSSESSSAMGLVQMKGTKPSEIESSVFSSERNENIEISKLKNDTRLDESCIDTEPILSGSVCNETSDQLREDNSQTLGFEENLTDNAISDDILKSGPSSVSQTPVFLDENNSGKNSLSVTSKAGSENPENPSFEENKLLDNSSKDSFQTETSNSPQSSNLLSDKNLMLSDQKSIDYRSVIYDNDLVDKSEPNEKLVSGSPSAEELVHIQLK